MCIRLQALTRPRCAQGLFPGAGHCPGTQALFPAPFGLQIKPTFVGGWLKSTSSCFGGWCRDLPGLPERASKWDHTSSSHTQVALQGEVTEAACGLGGMPGRASGSPWAAATGLPCRIIPRPGTRHLGAWRTTRPQALPGRAAANHSRRQSRQDPQAGPSCAHLLSWSHC